MLKAIVLLHNPSKITQIRTFFENQAKLSPLMNCYFAFFLIMKATCNGNFQGISLAKNYTQLHQLGLNIWSLVPYLFSLLSFLTNLIALVLFGKLSQIIFARMAWYK